MHLGVAVFKGFVPHHLALGRQRRAVGGVLERAIKQLAGVSRQRRAVDQKTHFAVQVRRSRIEIERTDKHPFVVDGESFRVQRRAGQPQRFEFLPPGRLTGAQFQFKQLHAGLQQLTPVFGVACMHHQHVGGVHRVGQHAYGLPLFG